MGPPRVGIVGWQGWIPGGCDQERRQLDELCFIGYLEQAEMSAYAEAGVTWWIECVWGDPVAALARVRQGPPR
jgi:hypothetical protein